MAEIKLKAMEMAGEEVEDLLTFSKALFRTRLNEAPAGIRQGDGYTIWPARDEVQAQSKFKVLQADCQSKNFYYGTFWTGKNLFSLSYFQTVLTTLTEYKYKRELNNKTKEIPK